MNFQLAETNIGTTRDDLHEIFKSLPCRDLLLHLLLQGNQMDPPGEIVEGMQDLDHILNVKDGQGNTVLHIAAANNLLAVVHFLLVELLLAVDVNGENAKGETALDICRALPSDTNSQEICRLLLEAGAQEGATGGHVSMGIDQPLLPTTSSASSSYDDKSLAHSSMETKGVLLVVLVLFAGASLTVVSNPPALIMESRQNGAASVAFRFSDVLTGYMPASFYLLVWSTAVFATSMGAIAVVLCFLPCTVVSQFVALMVLMLYILLVDKAMPRYTVKIGSRSISGSVFLWASALSLICCGVTVVALLKSVCSFVFHFATALKNRK